MASNRTKNVRKKYEMEKDEIKSKIEEEYKKYISDKLKKKSKRIIIRIMSNVIWYIYISEDIKEEKIEKWSKRRREVKEMIVNTDNLNGKQCGVNIKNVKDYEIS